MRHLKQFFGIPEDLERMHIGLDLINNRFAPHFHWWHAVKKAAKWTVRSLEGKGGKGKT